MITPMVARNILLSFATATILSACGTAAVIKDVQDKPVDELKAADSSKPIQFTKVVVKLKRGEHVGAIQAGLLCVGHGDLTWKGGRISIDSEEFTARVRQINLQVIDYARNA